MSRSVILAIASAVALTACGDKESTPPKASGPEPIVVRLGHAAPLTGPQAHIGKDNENGARLAVEDANAAKL